VREAWGSLDSVILNAGTCEYVDARQFDASIIEHVVRTNLFASSYCIEAALPLLRKGTAPHLVGMASSVLTCRCHGPKPMAHRRPGCVTCSNRCVSIWRTKALK
jgi:NAD(P)-dependent dehydrogenase (short-subunit alcohol dehydrogenase family)